MNIEILAKNIAAEMVESGALARALNKTVNSPVTSNATPPTASTGNFTPDQKLRFGLRGDVMNLVERIVEKHGIDKKIIFGELKKRTGVSQPEASPKQLSERIDLLQIWLETGSL